jgi:hypothetical protein
LSISQAAQTFGPLVKVQTTYRDANDYRQKTVQFRATPWSQGGYLDKNNPFASTKCRFATKYFRCRDAGFMIADRATQISKIGLAAIKPGFWF